VGSGVICVRSRPINAAHYTPVDGAPRLHGHTFRISVCLAGTVDQDGMILDFSIVDKFLDTVSDELNYSLLAPISDRDAIESLVASAPFMIKAVYLPAPATAETLGTWVCERLRQTLHTSRISKSYIVVEEGVGHRAVIKCVI